MKATSNVGMCLNRVLSAHASVSTCMSKSGHYSCVFV